jgi:heterodisulfide reductase subunit A
MRIKTREIKLAKHSILIVDDEPILRESLRDWLEEDGYEISLAATGEEALKILERKNFSLLIIDYRLPGMDGIAVLKRVKATKPSVKSFIITAFPQAELAVEAMKQGAIDFLIKPLALDNLEKLVNETLSE